MRRPLALALLIALSGIAPAGAADESVTEPGSAVKELTRAQKREESLNRLFARLRKADSEEAARVSEQAIWEIWKESDSPTAEVLLGQASYAMGEKDFAAAHTILDSLVVAHPGFAEAWNRRATLYFMEGKYAESVADIAKVLDLEPRHFGALSGLGMIRRIQGDTQGALDAFRDALAVNPRMPSIIQAIEELGGKQVPI